MILLRMGHLLGLPTVLAVEQHPRHGRALVLRWQAGDMAFAGRAAWEAWEVVATCAEAIHGPGAWEARPDIGGQYVIVAYRKLREAGAVQYSGERSAAGRAVWHLNPPVVAATAQPG